MAKSRDYLPVPWDWGIFTKEVSETFLLQHNRRYYGTPRRRAKYWKGNRRSRFHQYHKRLVNRQARRTPIDPGGLSLPPYTRRCVRRMDT